MLSNVDPAAESQRHIMIPRFRSPQAVAVCKTPDADRSQSITRDSFNILIKQVGTDQALSSVCPDCAPKNSRVALGPAGSWSMGAMVLACAAYLLFFPQTLALAVSDQSSWLKPAALALMAAIGSFWLIRGIRTQRRDRRLNAAHRAVLAATVKV